MKRLYFLITGLVLVITLPAQKVIQGQILDRSNSQPIPYANIGIINTPVGDLSDVKGYFKLTIPDNLSDEKISIQAPGYKLSSVEMGAISHVIGKIYLEPLVIELDEVVVTRKGPKIRTKELIEKEKITQLSSMTISQTESGGAAVASLFSSPYEGIWLDEVKIKIDQSLIDSIKLRVRFLSMKEDGTPGDDLFPRNIISATAIKKGWWSIDLKEHSIFINESRFFVCYELIEDVSTRKSMQKRRENKTSMMYALHDQGVKGIEIKKDEAGNRIGWASSLSRKEAQKYGVDFQTGNVYFTTSPSKNSNTFIRKSSFDKWKRLYNGRHDLVNGVMISYLPE